MSKTQGLEQLHAEIVQIRKRHKFQSDDDAFLYWYSITCLTEKESEAKDAVIGGAGDVNVDALYIDHSAMIVFVVQGKYRRNANASEGRNDLTALSDLGDKLLGEKAEFDALLSSANPLVARRLSEARDKVRKGGYQVALHFISTGSVSRGLFKEFERYRDELQYVILDRPRILRLLKDYVEGAAPPVPTLDLLLDHKDTLRVYDDERRVESWVIRMKGLDVAKLFKQAGRRIFSRNIRGFLDEGNSDVNKGMRRTLLREPERFWYYNNGIMIVCDGVRRISEHGEDKLRVDNPQIVNGQQTTRMLSLVPSSRASVLVRVIAIERDEPDRHRIFSDLVENIVAAANHQNPIFESDLRSNDAEQVHLERELRKRGYLYLRKRQSKREARAIAPQKLWWTVTKEQMAQAVGACVLDPYEVRAGRENLFGVDNYRAIFQDRAIATYLACFWLRRLVRRGSKGKPERAYAIWVVLHVLWKQMVKRLPGRRQQADLVSFLESAPWEDRGVRGLERGINALFQGALRFYRERRGSGEEAKDVSTFFRTRGLHTLLAEYLENPRNPLRRRVAAGFDRFVEAVQVAASENTG